MHCVSFLGWFTTVYLESFKSPFFSLYIKLWYFHFHIFRRLKVQAWACCGRTKLKLLIKFKLEVFLSWRDVTLWFTDDFLFDFKANKVSIKWNKFYLDLTIIKKNPLNDPDRINWTYCRIRSQNEKKRSKTKKGLDDVLACTGSMSISKQMCTLIQQRQLKISYGYCWFMGGVGVQLLPQLRS